MKRLKELKSSALSRGLAMAKVAASAGSQAAAHAMGNLFAEENSKPDRLKALLLSQAKLLTQELGQLKGTLMKAGQMLSVYGEHLLPPEANAILKSLQNQSPPVEWPVMEKVLKSQLPAERLAELEISADPIAAASLGQVHLATRKSDGAKIALKIQYPGVEQAIESDLKTLKRLLGMTKLIPQGPDYDSLFEEVRDMMKQEVDYRKELVATDRFRERLKGDPGFVVPMTYPEYSSDRVLATSYEAGFAVDSPEVLGLPQDRRDALATAALDLYYRELLVWNAVQTDPHFGNYKIRLANREAHHPGDSSQICDQIVLFDFGSVREIGQDFLKPYSEMIAGACYKDEKRLIQAGYELGFLKAGDAPEITSAFKELCFLITEPFEHDGPWNDGDLPKRVIKKSKELASITRLRPPPREIVFLDRKLGGVYVFVATLKARVNARAVLGRYLK